MSRQLRKQVSAHTCKRPSCRLGCRAGIGGFFQPAHKPAVAADDCFCNFTLLYAQATGKMTALPEAVQLNGAGQQQVAELRHALRVQARTGVQNCLDDPNSSSTEVSERAAVFKSLHKGCFVEQEGCVLSKLLNTAAHSDTSVLLLLGSSRQFWPCV